jgi:hypothetical protein
LDENPGGRGAADATEFTLERPFASLFETTPLVIFLALAAFGMFLAYRAAQGADLTFGIRW